LDAARHLPHVIAPLASGACGTASTRIDAAGYDVDSGLIVISTWRLLQVSQLRTPVTGDVGRVFRALGIALPPNIREADVAPTNGPCRPKRGAKNPVPGARA
jgi:hypothetical protein